MAEHSVETTKRIKTRLKLHLADVIGHAADGRDGPQSRQAMVESVRAVFETLPEEFQDANLSGPEQVRLAEEVVDEVVGYGPITQYINDPTVTEIMVNGPHEMFVERKGQLERVPETFRDTQHLLLVIERMLGSVNLSVNESEPVCDASLADGSRINVIIPPLVLNGPVVTIRTRSQDWTLDQFVKVGALSQQAAEFLACCVHAKVNLVISGGTSTGKTTLVSILSHEIGAKERIITIENVPELELPGREHWIRLVGRAANIQGRGEIPLRVLVKNALRMRPDRIILGEARGGEALDVVQAMHSGHDGVMTVLHANTPRAALERMQMLMLMSGLDVPPAACRVQIASALDIVVHVGRFADGSRKISAISEVLDPTPDAFVLGDIFTFDVEGYSKEGKLRGVFRYTGLVPQRVLSKFRLANVEAPAWMTT